MRIALLVGVLALVVVVGLADDDGGVKSRTKEAFNVGGNSLTYRARDATGKKGDRIEYTVTTGNNGIKTDYRYQTKSLVDGGQGPAAASSLRMRMRVSRIVEFDASGGDTPTVANAKTLLNLDTWNNFVQLTDAFSGSVVGATVSTSDNVFTLTARFSSDITNTSLNLNPNQAKYDFTITGFPFKQPVVTTSKLAIAMLTATSSKTKTVTGSGGNYQVVVNNDQAAGVNAYWSWSPTLTASNSDGSNPVALTVKAIAYTTLTASDPDFDNSDSGTQYRVWAVIDTVTHYPKYVWDPAVGLDYSGSFSVASTSVSVVVAGIALTILSKWM